MPHNHTASSRSTPADRFVGKSLLLVEDDRSIRLLLAQTLELSGFEVFAFGEGLSALRYLDEFPPPDVVVVDLGLPDSDGIEVGQRVRSVANQVLMVAITGLGGEKERTAALQVGFDLFLLKPFDPEELIRLMESKLG